MHTRRPDTRAWRAQVWISFATAAGLAGTGLAWLPGGAIERAFMLMGYGFCLAMAFTLAKHVRDEQAAGAGATRVQTPLWGGVVWGGFALAMALTGWGLVQMDVSPTYKAFLGVSWLFLMSSAFTLAKTLRDAHEAALTDHSASQS